MFKLRAWFRYFRSSTRRIDHGVLRARAPRIQQRVNGKVDKVVLRRRLRVGESKVGSCRRGRLERSSSLRGLCGLDASHSGMDCQIATSFDLPSTLLLIDLRKCGLFPFSHGLPGANELQRDFGVRLQGKVEKLSQLLGRERQSIWFGIS